MTPEEIKEARLSLGLTVAQFGNMLDIADERTMRRHMSPVNPKQPSPRMVRLVKAYMAGYRPDDWPQQ